MRQINILNYILDLAHSNKYLKVIINFLEPKIFNEKGDVIFVFFYRIKPRLSH